MTKQKENLNVFNYCLGFIDLLGQREAVRGQHLLPSFNTEEEKQEFYKAVKKSIGSIEMLQTQADSMLDRLFDGSVGSPFRDNLSKEDKKTWDKMQNTKIIKQRWSDGLASFVCLGDKEVKCQMNGIFGILVLCGSLCFLGLTIKQPIRGAIDVAWGVELHPGELYGPVVARAYELESEVAQYPRIVVSSYVVDMLKAYRDQTGTDHFSQLDKVIANLCLEMLALDVDGHYFIHYLGDKFRESVTQDHHSDMYKEAKDFVTEQLLQHQKDKNTKLAFRYGQLLNYFYAHSS